MERKVNEKTDTKLLILILAVVVLVIVNLILFTKKFYKPEIVLLW